MTDGLAPIHRCGNVASILELDEHLTQEYKVFRHAAPVSVCHSGLSSFGGDHWPLSFPFLSILPCFRRREFIWWCSSALHFFAPLIALGPALCDVSDHPRALGFPSGFPIRRGDTLVRWSPRRLVVFFRSFFDPLPCSFDSRGGMSPITVSASVMGSCSSSFSP